MTQNNGEDVWFSPTYLERIISNLLSNAIKYTGENGNIDVRASIVEGNDNSVYLQLEVKDTGIGIVPEELDNIFKRLYEDNISGKLTDERFRKLSQDYEDEQGGLKAQVLLLREEIEAVECKSANVDRFLSIVDRYTEIPELTPHILHEFVEKIVIYAATDPHSKVNRRQQVDIYYKGIGILEISKVFDTRHK